MPATPRVLLALLPTVLLGAQELMPINDWRVGLTLGLAPSVREEVRTDAGKGTYDWSGRQGFALRYQLDYLNGLHRRGIARAGFLWGVGLLHGDLDIRPERFDRVGGAPVADGRPTPDLRYRQYGLSLYAGYATVPSISAYGEWTLEFLPVVRGGYGWAETVDPDRRRSVAGGGTFWEAGGQVAWTLQDKGWLLSTFGGVTYRRATIDIDLDGGGASDLTLYGISPEVGLAIGARF